MKQLLVFVLLYAAAFNSLAQQGSIQFTIKNAPSDSCVIAYYLNGKQYVLSEEDQVEEEEAVNKVMTLNASGKGTFTHKEMPTGMYLIVFLPANEYVQFLYEGKAMSLSFDFNAVSKTLKTDSKANEVLYQRMAFIEELSERKTKIDEKKNADPSYAADADLAALDAEYAAYNAKLYQSNPTNLAVKVFKAMDVPTIPDHLAQDEALYYYRSHFFDNIDFSVGWTVRMPFFSEKLNTYVQDLTVDDPDSLIVAWDYLIGLAKGNEEMQKLLVIHGVNTYATSKTIAHEAVYCHFVDTYYLSGKATWADDTQIEKLRKATSMLRNNLLGRIASNFTIKTSDNKEMSLLEVKEVFTLLIFVQNNCGSCKGIERDLIELKASIPANVKVIEVLYTTDVAEAVSKKSEEGVYWEVGVLGRTYDLESTKENYNLTVFPRVFVLDKDKKIVGKRVDLEQALEIIAYYSK